MMYHNLSTETARRLIDWLFTAAAEGAVVAVAFGTEPVAPTAAWSRGGGRDEEGVRGGGREEEKACVPLLVHVNPRP